ncbi:MAG: acetate--CoA ligase family protein, partial [Planctomycetes bacterium]|nr:acetate--CoA ligase family protein [Planctomycetota bacterium]
MKIHEYQAKQIFARYRIPVPRGKVAVTPEEAGRIHDELNSPLAVVKAQVHAGGRGKGGGVKLARSREATEKAAREILSKPLVTPQTGPEGRKVHRVLVEEGIDLDREFYLGMTIDRAKEAPVVMASSEGGVEIEEVAKRFPQKIHKVHLSSMEGLAPFEARSLFYALGLDGALLGPFSDLVTGLARAFLDLDASLVEVNPLVTRKSGGVLALDAKMNFDDNALFRHPEVLELRDLAEEEPAEIEASKHDLSYIRLDGSIGCM